MRPQYITATRWATSATTPRSWVIRITAAPVSARRRASTASTCACTVTSSAVVGSSAMISCGRPDIAMAITAALAHAAGELVRILPRASGGIGDVDLAQQLDRPAPASLAGEAAMRDLAFGDLPADRQHRVQRGGRVLEDEADILAAHLPQALGARADDLRRRRRTIEPLTTRRVGQQPGDGERGDALARTGLADDAEHFVAMDVEIDAPHRGHRPPRAGERHLERAHRQDRVRHQAIPFAPPPAGARAQGLNPSVRATSMLSISSVKPPTFWEATIRPLS